MIAIYEADRSVIPSEVEGSVWVGRHGSDVPALRVVVVPAEADLLSVSSPALNFVPVPPAHTDPSTSLGTTR
jgi:hypothetical protein